MKRKDSAAAEIIGEILLLAMAVAAFSVVYIGVLSNDGPGLESYATIIGKMEPEADIANTVSFENRRGETLGPDTKIMLEIGGSYGDYAFTTVKELSLDYTFLQDGWDIGEKLYPVKYLGDLTDVKVDGKIVDEESNSIVFWGILQEGLEVPLFGRGGIWHFNEPDGWDNDKRL